MLQAYLRRTEDPRAAARKVIWDNSPYYGSSNPQSRKQNVTRDPNESEKLSCCRNWSRSVGKRPDKTSA